MENVLFADDTAIFHADKLNIDLFVENIKLCENWFEKNCLSINESKCQYMIFGRKKSVELEAFGR